MTLALAEAWLGTTLAFHTDWPSSFWITARSAGVYLIATIPLPAWSRQVSVRPREVTADRAPRIVPGKC